MPVSDHLAFPLLRAFGQLEYELKQRSGLLRADRYGNAMVDWGAVKAAIAALPAGSFQARLSERTLDKMLGGARNRPRVQIVEEVHGRPAPHFVVQDLDRDDARALVELPNGCGTISSTAARKTLGNSRSMAMTTNGGRRRWMCPKRFWIWWTGECSGQRAASLFRA